MDRMILLVVLATIAVTVFFTLHEHKPLVEAEANTSQPIAIETKSVSEPPVQPSQTSSESIALLPASGTDLRVIAIYPPGNQLLSDEIILYFNENLAPFESPAVTEEQAISTEPPLKGMVVCKDNYLQFTAVNINKVFNDPNTNEFTLIVHKNLRSLSGQSLPDDMRRYSFIAPPPEIKNVKMKDITPETATVQLSFSRVVDLDKLSSLLSISDSNHEPVKYLLSKDANNHQAVLSVPLTTSLPINGVIAAGLPWGPENQFSTREISFRYPTSNALSIPKALIKTDDIPFIELYFQDTVPISWLEYLATITKTNSDTPIPFSLDANNSKPGKTARLLLPNTEEMKTLEEATISISSWFCSSRGTRHAYNASIKARKTLPTKKSTRSLVVYNNYWEGNVANGHILRLRFNQTIYPEELLSHLEITPPVEFSLTTSHGYSRDVGLKGAFKSKTNYTLRIKAGIKNSSNEVVLSSDRVIALRETSLRKGTVFESPHLYYFPRRTMANPRIQARNTTEAHVTLAQVFPSNLPVFVRDLRNSGATPHLIHQYAQPLEKEITVPFPDTPDTLLDGEVNLKTLLPADKKGVFIMSLSPSYDYRTSTRLLIYTDLGVLTHWDHEELVVFVHNLFSLVPETQAKVTVYSSKLQPLGVTYTNSDGIARFMSFEKSFGAPALVLVETKNDYTFLDLVKEQDVPKNFTASMPFYDKEGYDGYVYLDRNLYRPGETVQIRWMARTHYVDAVTEIPFQLRILNPQDRCVYEAPVTPSAFGTGSLSFNTEKNFPTGRYQIHLCVPQSKRAFGETAFNLEDFVPNTMQTEVRFDCERFVADHPVTIQVKAENLYGGPAADRKAKASIYLRPTVYESDTWEGYHFGNEDTLDEQVLPLGEVTTNKDGLAVFKYRYKPIPEVTMPLNVTVNAQVLELGGRAVSDTANAILLPFDIMLGIAAAPRNDAEMLDVHIAAIKNDDTPAALEQVQVTLEREEWNYYIRSFSNTRKTHWEKEFIPVQNFEVALSAGKGDLEIPYPGYGTYRVRVHAPDTKMYSTLQFNRWWGRLNIVSSPRTELINLTVDKERYQIGDEVNLRIESPYNGNAYVVIQGDSMLEERIVPVEKGEGQATFTVSQAWFPNAWIMTTVVRNAETKEGAQYPYSSFSMVNVPLDMPERHIHVSLPNVPLEIRPAEPFTIHVDTRDATGAPVEAEVTVAAVDEGIHGILGYENPDPYQWFQRSRKFNLLRAHYYDSVFFDSTLSPIGGDAMRRMGLTSQVGENWIHPVALWSGEVMTDVAGQATITFDVPEFIGQLRLVAVAATPSATGATANKVYVRRPYILKTSMPRFALPGDHFECTATAINMTATPVTAQLSWKASGTLSGAGEKRLELGPNSELPWRAPITAGATPGQGEIAWTLTVSNANSETLETVTENALLPVNSPAAYQTETALIALAPGETRVIENTQFVEEPSLRTSLHVAGTPLWRLYPGLRYLLRYPYGCVEQVTSKAMPLYLLRNYADIYQDILPKDKTIDGEVVDSYIRAAIEQLLLMQTSGGGLSTWAGGTHPYPYGSVYALHFLTLIQRDHSYKIYEDAFRSLQNYVASVMRDEHGYSKYPYDYYLRAYACYVLALDGNLEALEYIPRFDHVGIPTSARYLLAAAKAMNAAAIDSDALKRYVADAPVAEFSERQYGGTLHSGIRADAIKLIALIQMKAAPEKMQPFVDSLFNYFAEKHYYYSTQESAFATTALGMYIEHCYKGDPEMIGAHIVAPDGEHTLDGEYIYESTIPGASPRYEINNTGKTPVYINLEMSGLPLQARTKPKAEGLEIKRAYFHETGKAITDNAFKHGEQYIVELTIKPKRNLENLLLVDLLPAGFEVANPRLEPDIQPESERDSRRRQDVIFTPDHLEVRDDRVAMAINHVRYNEEHVFRYLVRAVTPGIFELPSLHAECMYQPTTHADTVPGEISIQ